MKGGKAGRDKKSAPRGKPKPQGAAKSAAKRPEQAPPKKGSRKKPGYGGSSSAGDE